MKIYIVTSGSYSDYGIDAVFTDHEKALEFVRIFNGGSYNIEEYESDPKIPPKIREGYWIYKVTLYKNGDLYGIYEYDSEFFYIDSPNFKLNEPKIRKTFDEQDVMDIIVQALTEEGAIKIANEFRTRLIAENSFETK